MTNNISITGGFNQIEVSDYSVLKSFAKQVHAKALDLMSKDGKVEGKHFAAMKLILQERGVDVNLEMADTPKTIIIIE